MYDRERAATGDLEAHRVLVAVRNTRRLAVLADAEQAGVRSRIQRLVRRVDAEAVHVHDPRLRELLRRKRGSSGSRSLVSRGCGERQASEKRKNSACPRECGAAPAT